MAVPGEDLVLSQGDLLTLLGNERANMELMVRRYSILKEAYERLEKAATSAQEVKETSPAAK